MQFLWLYFSGVGGRGLKRHRFSTPVPAVEICGDLARFPNCTALGSDGQGPHGFSFVFWILFDFSDLFTDLARASLGLLGASVELVVRPSTYGAHNRTAAL